MMPTFVCCLCGSPNVAKLKWVDVNEDISYQMPEDETAEYFKTARCFNCNQITEIVTLEDYNESQQPAICHSCGGSGEGRASGAPPCSVCKGDGELSIHELYTF